MKADSINSRYRIMADRGRKYLTDQIEFAPTGFITIVPLYCSTEPNWEPRDVKMMIPVHFVQEIIDSQPVSTKAESEPGMADVQAAAQS
jgi:hypothetical protein